MAKKVTLTIDNGPTPGVTDMVLDVLRVHDVEATFFVIGEKVVRPGGRDLIARIHREGHRIGNHSYTHKVLFGSEPDQSRVISEIDRTQEALGEFGAERLFRPFGGGGVLDRRVLSRTAVRHLGAQGYTLVLWNSVPGDLEDPAGWPETALGHIAEKDWTVTVVHDLPTGAMNELGRFIAMARDEGVEFRSDFPRELMPIVAGEVQANFDDIVSDR